MLSYPTREQNMAVARMKEVLEHLDGLDSLLSTPGKFDDVIEVVGPSFPFDGSLDEFIITNIQPWVERAHRKVRFWHNHKVDPASIIGTRVVLTKNVDRYPHTIVKAGATGTIANSSKHDVWVKLDKKVSALEEWNNELQFPLEDEVGWHEFYTALEPMEVQ